MDTETEQQIRKWHAEGKSSRQIARLVKETKGIEISHTTVARVLKKPDSVNKEDRIEKLICWLDYLMRCMEAKEYEIGDDEKPPYLHNFDHEVFRLDMGLEEGSKEIDERIMEADRRLTAKREEEKRIEQERIEAERAAQREKWLEQKKKEDEIRRRHAPLGLRGMLIYSPK